MFGIVVEYAAGEAGALPDPPERATCCATLVRQPGYRRRLAIVADGWRRVADLFLFADADAARAALAGDAGRELAARSSCRDAGPALLVSACPCGGPVVLLRGRATPTGGGQGCWRDHSVAAAPAAVLW